LKNLVIYGLLAISLMLGFSLASRSEDDIGADLLNEYNESVFRLTPRDNPESGGTGFSLQTPSGKLVTITNRHVCEASNNGLMVAHLRNGHNVTLNIKVMSSETDLCMLDAVEEVKPFKLASHIRNFEKLYIIGHPLLRDTSLEDGRIVERKNVKIPTPKPFGDCVGKMFTIEDLETFFGPRKVCVANIDAFDTSIVVYGGNSGSPTINKYGEVVGVLFASNLMTRYGLVVPLDWLRRFVS
jgi:hypothetical protein